MFSAMAFDVPHPTCKSPLSGMPMVHTEDIGEWNSVSEAIKGCVDFSELYIGNVLYPEGIPLYLIRLMEVDEDDDIIEGTYGCLEVEWLGEGFEVPEGESV